MARFPFYPVDPRVCVICGESFSPRENESPSAYQRRKTCSVACGHRSLAAAKTKTVAPKPCVVCGAIMEIDRAGGERKQVFDKRKTCSDECRRVSQGLARKGKKIGGNVRADVGSKPCVICGVLFERGPRERVGEFHRRQTCDHACAVEYVARRNRRHGRMAPSMTRRHWFPIDWTDDLKTAIRQRDGFVCRLCGVPENGRAHHVHHIDYVRQHIDHANLITLCPRCHGKTNYRRDHWRAVLSALMLEVSP